MALKIPVITSITSSTSANSLYWDDNQTPENSGYLIQRKTDFSDWTQVDSISANSFTYTDSKYIIQESNYYYRIKPIQNAGVIFGFSDSKSTTTLGLSAENVVLVAEGKYNFLKDYFTTNIFYLGLWTTTNENALIKDPDFLSNPLSGFTSLYELNSSYSGYYRFKIPKSNWMIDEIENSITLNTPIQFTTLNQWDNIVGYFICTSSDNSGKLIWIDTLKQIGVTIDLKQRQYLTITPKLIIY